MPITRIALGSILLLLVSHIHCATAYAADRILVWSDDGDGNRIEKSDLDGNNRVAIVLDLGSPTAIAFEQTSGLLHWIDNNSVTIERVGLDGLNREVLLSAPDIVNLPLGLAINSEAGKLFWSDNHDDSIWSANLDGSGVQLLLDNTVLHRPAGLFVDNLANKLYWVDAGNGNVGRSNLDGSSVEILATGFALPQELLVDHTNNRVLITDLNSDALFSVDLTTNLTTTLLSITDPTGLALDPVTGQIYVAESNTDTIRRIESDGTGLTTIINTGLSNPYGLAVITLPIPGDLNGDGFVGVDDLNIVLGNWNQNVPPGNPLADPSGDGFVGIADLGTVLDNWNTGWPPISNTTVPEPTIFAITSLCGVIVLKRRK